MLHLSSTPCQCQSSLNPTTVSWWHDQIRMRLSAHHPLTFPPEEYYPPHGGSSMLDALSLD